MAHAVTTQCVVCGRAAAVTMRLEARPDAPKVALCERHRRVLHDPKLKLEVRK